MKLFIAAIVAFFTIGSLPAQTIVYSDINKKDNRSISFEILGNIGGHTAIYKNKDKNHRLSLYDNNMKLFKDVDLGFIANKTFNIDFVVYPDYFYAVYQFQSGMNVHCNAAKISPEGALIGEVITIDTARVGYFADNKVFFTEVSDNKQRILVYKAQNRNDRLLVSAFVYDRNFVKLDSHETSYDDLNRREVFSDFKIGNDGSFYYVKEKHRGRNDYAEKVELFTHKFQQSEISSHEIKLEKLLTQDLQIKIDNQSERLFLNGFLYNRGQGGVGGVLTLVYNAAGNMEQMRRETLFTDSIRQKLTTRSGSGRYPFDNFSIQSVVNKKDNGILLTLEETYSDTRGFYNNRFDRYGLYNDPFNYYSSPGFYRFQRGYYGNYYSPYNNNFNRNNVLYNYNDIIMISLDDSLKTQWESIINKKQSDVDTDNYLSYSTVNTGGLIHYLYLQKDNNKQVISDNALQPNGEIKRYATIKSGEKGYNFMPRLAKQVSANSVIVPAVYRNNIGFAKIYFE